MGVNIGNVDNTHVGNVANPSGAKKASGDSSSGVDAATLKAVAENLVVNGMIDLSAIQMIDRSTLSHLNNQNITSVSANKKVEQRSEKINELAFGMNSSNFQSTKVNSLGDLMCELMILMIQSTSERRQMERELRTILTVANMDQSKQIAEDIMEKMKLDVEDVKVQAWGQFAIAAGSMAVSMGGMANQAKMKIGKASFFDQKSAFMGENLPGSLIQSLGRSAISFVGLVNIKKSAQLEASISRKQAALRLTQSVANSVESSLKSIDSTREYFLSLMTQISQALHDNKMQIIRNSAI